MTQIFFIVRHSDGLLWARQTWTADKDKAARFTVRDDARRIAERIEDQQNVMTRLTSELEP